ILAEVIEVFPAIRYRADKFPGAFDHRDITLAVRLGEQDRKPVFRGTEHGFPDKMVSCPDPQEIKDCRSYVNLRIIAVRPCLGFYFPGPDDVTGGEEKFLI